MPAKPSRARRKTRKRTTRRGKGARATRIVVFTLGFIVILFLFLFGINYLKQNAAPDFANKELSPTEFDHLVKDIDQSLTTAFFEAGISSQNISSKNVYNKEQDNLNWEYKDIDISAEKGVTSKKVKTILEKSVMKRYPVQYNFKDGKNSLTASIKVNNITTHKIRFNFYRQAIVKKESKKEQTEKQSNTVTKTDTKKNDEVAVLSKPSLKTDKTAVGGPKPKIVIIVDDLGLNKNSIDQLLKLPAPITFAVLPNLPYSTYAAQKADLKGWDVILHMPMEPKESSGYTGVDAGEEVLLVGLPKDAILTKLNDSIASMPQVKGINNHMGSKFMENQELTELILKDLKKRDMIFVDSKTSAQSKGYETALKLGMDTAQRDLFLDNSSKKSDIIVQIKKLVELSKKKGYAVGICHPYPGTLQALTEMIPQITDEVEVVSISNIINSSSN